MANNLIFRAADASAAMEKVQNALGPDAYIIDISNVGNFVEITASKDEPIQGQPNKPVNPRKSLALAKRKLDRFCSSWNSCCRLVGRTCVFIYHLLQIYGLGWRSLAR